MPSKPGPSRTVVIGLVGCALPACAYQPGSFHAPLQHYQFRGERVTVGCLDVAVAPLSSAVADGQVVEVTFANRCDRATVVDFAALRATARDAAGNERALAVFDPDQELRPLQLEARTTGHEVIELQTTTLPHAAITGACLDLGSLARADQARWVCVAGEPAWPSLAAVAEAAAPVEPAAPEAPVAGGAP